MKKIGILGATGSVGRQCIDVIRATSERWEVALLSGYHNTALLGEYAATFPRARIVGANESDRLSDPETYLGLDLVVNAIGGTAGLKPTFAILESGVTLATANKESLVAAGELFNRTRERTGTTVIPVDSEHSAVFQCLQGERRARRILLTASGGPFRSYTREQIAAVTAADALRHPTWKMGKKVTVDSATMLNKGFEVLEARTLFGACPVDVVVHPESVVHALVEFDDGVMKAVLSKPDMRDPIRYALGYPKRIASDTHTNLIGYGALHFEEPDEAKFPALALARCAAAGGDWTGTVLAAADEVAVQLFLQGKIGFYGITDLIEEALCHFGNGKLDSVEDAVSMDAAVKEYTFTKAKAGGSGC